MEKKGYREMLVFLSDKGVSMLCTRAEAAKVLGIGQQNLRKEIAKGKLKLQDNRIPIGSLASYLCG